MPATGAFAVRRPIDVRTADETKGEVVRAWVVLRQGEQVSEQDLRAFWRERLAPYKVPARIEFRTDLPKTLVGKVLRRALRDGH